MSPIFNEQLRAAQAGLADESKALVWTQAHSAWMARPHREQVHTQAALDFANWVNAGGDIVPRDVEHGVYRFGASSVGGEHGEGFNCHRASLFHFAGVQREHPTELQQDNMDNGSALHLKYQMEGISAGYITSAETWYFDRTLRYGMKDDGILYDDSLLELKFVNTKKFNAVLFGDRQWGQAPGPLHSHLLQVTGGMMLRGLEASSLVYISKETGAPFEFRVPYRPELADELLTLLDDLNDWVNLGRLPAILDGCAHGGTWLAANCEYRTVCPLMTALQL